MSQQRLVTARCSASSSAAAAAAAVVPPCIHRPFEDPPSTAPAARHPQQPCRLTYQPDSTASHPASHHMTPFHQRAGTPLPPPPPPSSSTPHSSLRATVHGARLIMDSSWNPISTPAAAAAGQAAYSGDGVDSISSSDSELQYSKDNSTSPHDGPCSAKKRMIHCCVLSIDWFRQCIS